MKRNLIAFIWLLLVIQIPAQNPPKPIIGLSSASVNGVSASVHLAYVKSVTKAGGIPVVLPVTCNHEDISRLLDAVDGVILTGGEDIDPLTWYNEQPLPQLETVALRRDSFDIELARLAVERNIPLLGICRGHQVLNVAFGGSLYQDIPAQIPLSKVNHRPQAAYHEGTHTIYIVPGSLLHLQTRLDSVNVNSFHHQAIKEVAPGFRSTATTSDGVVEAIEKVGNQRVYGVQFHPEGFVAHGEKTLLGIFTHLVNEARNYHQEQEKAAPKKVEAAQSD